MSVNTSVAYMKMVCDSTDRNWKSGDKIRFRFHKESHGACLDAHWI